MKNQQMIEVFETQIEQSTTLKAFEVWIEDFAKTLDLSVSQARKVMESMIEEGSIAVVDNLVYRLNHKPYAVGTFRAVRETFGFVETDAESVYIAKEGFNHALDRDDVLIEIKSEEKQFGVIIGIIKHHKEYILGTMKRVNGGLDFVPYDQKIKHSIEYTQRSLNPVEGDRLIGKIVAYGEILELELVSILGQADEPGMDVLSVLYEYGIETEFSDEVLEAADKVPSEVDPKDFKGRVDHRDQYVITVDGEDAKDLDDAIFIERKNDGYRLYVHIADVAHYVPKNSVIDASAYERSSSVYMVDRVVPMLPKVLSNGICSLHPHVDRLTMSVQMDFNAKGKMNSYHVYESIINSKQRLSYNQVNAHEGLEEAQELVNMMLSLATILNHKRDLAGSIGFDSDESQFLIDHHGNVLDVFKRSSGAAEKMIESFMVSANEAVAQFARYQLMPVLYRVHEHPTKEKMQDLSHTLRILGYKLRGSLDAVRPKLLQKALEFFEDKPEYPVVSRLMLRSMSKARYATEPLGHFGLALEDYTHFTSPIRRYPDLMLHQRIKEYASNIVSDKVRLDDEAFAFTAQDYVSSKERSIMDAEREVEKIKKAQFMQDKVGQVFTGFVSGVSGFGMFIELPNTVEGLVHVRTLRDDFYTFDAGAQKLIGERSNNVYALGQKVQVKLVSIDMNEFVINFELVRVRRRKVHHERRRKKQKSIS